MVEAGKHLIGVHPQLDHFQSHAPADGFGLLGKVDRAHAPFAEQAQNPVGSEAVPLGGFWLVQGHGFSAGFARREAGAATTQAWGINLSGDIVGNYVSADKANHGFLKSRGQYSSIDFPGAAFTEVNGISPRGDVIGDYAATLTGSGPHHGFVLSRD